MGLEDHIDRVACICFVADDLMVSGSADRTVRVYETEEWRCVGILSDHAGPVTAVCACQDFLATGSQDTTVRVHLLAGLPFRDAHRPQRLADEAQQPAWYAEADVAEESPDALLSINSSGI